ncbi:maleylacetoacetate isomerase [Antarctobacter jejuensis]|uniref:maleylacetoacetate isomerase n=1 Tax=Antarctobacter jejuensis TaxID=1439938 RepID=UPI003FD3B8F1
MSTSFILYDYWRSSASYRVRIALNLLGLPYESRPINLVTGQHRADDYMALNPQGLLPTLLIDGQPFTQSLAILEYLHAQIPGSTLLPSDPYGQYLTRQVSYAIAMEIHPVCNLNVASHAAQMSGGGEEAKRQWMLHFITRGLHAVEAMLPGGTRFCLGSSPGMADVCLIPQLYNATRWGVDLSPFHRIRGVAAACDELEAFRRAHPDQVGPPPD